MSSPILHVDLDAFYAAVATRDRPELQGEIYRTVLYDALGLQRARLRLVRRRPRRRPRHASFRPFGGAAGQPHRARLTAPVDPP